MTEVEIQAGSPSDEREDDRESPRTRRIRENSNTPKKKKLSTGVAKQVQKKRDNRSEEDLKEDSNQLNLFEEYTYILQPFLCFIHSIHRIVFFLDYNDKCILYQNIFRTLNAFLNEFFFVTGLQSKLYQLKANLKQLNKADEINFEDFGFLNKENQKQPKEGSIPSRLRSNTTDIVGLYNNEGIKHIPQEMRRKRVPQHVHVRLESISSFPYLLTLLVDLEQLFSELKEFFISLNQESFFERLGILSEVKLKNKKRIHR